MGGQLQLQRLDLGAVLRALKVSQFGHELVGGAVESAGLCVEHVDEPPKQALALVGDLEPVGCDALAQDAEGLGDSGQRVVLVPDLAGVELAALGCGAEEGCVVADGRGDGLRFGLDGVDVLDDVHDDLLLRPPERCAPM